MRQRLLLVAGWIVAAVGAGVVASGAVAAAGGQVLERPLRPLTAAEVAALPVDETMVTFDSNGPHASGGSESTVESTIVGSGSETTGPTGADEPAGPGGASADQPATPGDDTLEPSEAAGVDRDVLSVSQPTSDVAVAHINGGSASLAAVDDELRVLWATPKPGYVVGLRFESPTQLFLTFTSTSNLSTLAAVLDDSGILIDTSETRR
ncbi:MAG: hypothetical protein ABFS21_05615 [Actinomycetota bacterium]